MPNYARNLTRKTTYIHAILFSTMGLLSAQSLAGGPVPFNQWSVSNGVIDASATCNASGVSCTLLAQDNGLLQQQVNTASGSYIQLIVTDTDASGTAESLGFVTENFIPTNNLTAWDINGQQIIRDPDQGFEQVATIERAPFQDINNQLVDLLHVNLQQSLIKDGFDTHFNLTKDEAQLSSGEIVSGKSIDMNQNIVAASASNAAGVKMAFDTRIRSGMKLTEVNQDLQMDPFAPAGTLALNDGGINGNPGTNQNLDWNDGDTVSSLWISQYNDELNTSGYAFQRVENLSNGTSINEARLDSAAVIDPFSWNDVTFGQAPTLP